MASVIPAALRSSIEEKAGGVISDERPRGGGGASRQGAEVTLTLPDGTAKRCYLSWDPRAGDPARLPYFERETAILQALSGPFVDSGVRAARIYAAEPAFLAHLCAFVEGNDRFPQATEKDAIAQDFIGQLAKLHAIDVGHVGLAPLGVASQSPSERIRDNLTQWRAAHLVIARPEPIFQLALDWLLANIPEDVGGSVVVHGDAGPGNFLFDGDRVVALVDWELVHLGDPVEDLAQIAVRSLIQPFVPMADVIAGYERVSGHAVDRARIKFHRLYFQISFLVPGHIAQQSTNASAPTAIGQAMLFSTMHRRVIVESLGELMGHALLDHPLPECPPTANDSGFAVALDDIKDEIVPHLSNQRAATKAKSLARLIKYWRMRDRCGAQFDTEELAQLRQALGGDVASIAEGRTALARAIAAGAINPEDALQLSHNRMRRETHMMADAMGALATTTYESMETE